MIKFQNTGDLLKTKLFLERCKNVQTFIAANKYGQMGVDALKAATPKDTGKTSESWKFKVESRNGNLSITWYNTNENKGENIALLIQYGHGTGRGSYIKGIDYINPALKPVFDQIAEEAWREITRS